MENEPIPHHLRDMIDTVMDEFDFEKVHAYMTSVGWKWIDREQTKTLGHKVYSVPAIRDLRKTARELLVSVSKSGEASLGTGGLYATKNPGLLKLMFVLTEAYAETDTAVEHEPFG